MVLSSVRDVLIVDFASSLSSGSTASTLLPKISHEAFKNHWMLDMYTCIMQLMRV